MAEPADEHTPADWSIDDAYRYLTQVIDTQDLAIYELNQKFAQGRLRLHWRRTDAAGLGQEGDVPSVSWQSGILRVSRDFNRNEVDWAAGRITAKNDDRAFVASATGQPGHTYDLTVSAHVVRKLWPLTASDPAPPRPTAGDAERPPPDADKITQLVWAYIRLLNTNRAAGLRGKALLKAVCAEVGPNFTASLSSFKTAKRKAKARLA